MEITVNLFGKFRLLGDQMKVVLPTGSNVAALRTAFADRLAKEDEGWIADVQSSRFATDKALLLDTSDLPTSAEVAIIPPVSGG